MFKERNVSLLVVTEEDKEAVRKSAHILSEEQLQSDIDSIVEWFQIQPHLPKVVLDRDMVERLFISRKGSKESTQQTIDMMFAAKCMVPELAAPRDVFHAEILKTFSAMIFTPLPKLNHDRTRVNLYRYTEEVDNYDFRYFLNYVFMTIEYRLKCDYAAGDRSLIDFQHRSLSHMSKENPAMIKNCEVFIREAYGIHLLGIHIINAPSFLNSIISLVKSCLSPKLSSRIHVHPDYDDLYCHIDRDVLPAEYGGHAAPAVELVESWKLEFAKPSIREYMLQQEGLLSDESKRIGPPLDKDTFGVSAANESLEID